MLRIMRVGWAQLKTGASESTYSSVIPGFKKTGGHEFSTAVEENVRPVKLTHSFFPQSACLYHNQLSQGHTYRLFEVFP